MSNQIAVSHKIPLNHQLGNALCQVMETIECVKLIYGQPEKTLCEFSLSNTSNLLIRYAKLILNLHRWCWLIDWSCLFEVASWVNCFSELLIIDEQVQWKWSLITVKSTVVDLEFQWTVDHRWASPMKMTSNNREVDCGWSQLSVNCWSPMSKSNKNDL